MYFWYPFRYKVIQYLIRKLLNMVKMTQEGLLVAVIIASVRMSWKVPIYYKEVPTKRVFCSIFKNNRQITNFYSYFTVDMVVSKSTRKLFDSFKFGRFIVVCVKLSLKKSKGMCGKTIWEFVWEYYVKSEVGHLGVVDT